MPHLEDMNFSGPDDPDAMVMQLPSQRESLTPKPAALADEPESQRPKDEICPSLEAGSMEFPSIEIRVPVVDNPGEYEYLPGHFKIRRIIRIDSSNPEKPLYTVCLASGELSTMSRDTLMSLDNGAQALAELVPESESDDELMAVGYKPTSNNYFGGDGAGHGKRTRIARQSTQPRRQASSARGSYAAFYEIPESSSSDEDSDESSDELKGRFPKRRRRSTRISRKVFASSDEDDDSSDLEAPNRVSTRTRKSARQNLRERLEDDFSEAESEAPKRQKYSGAREAFPELPRDDEFRLRHFACCSTCNYFEDDDVKGSLVFCQGCSSSYHQQCLGPRSSREHLVTKIDEEHFILQCRRCLGVAHSKHDVSPHLGRCAVCKEDGSMSQPLRERLTPKEEQQQRVANGGTDPTTHIDMTRVNNIDDVLFRCAKCQRAFHFEHLPAPNSSQDLSDVISHYTTHWQCKDCSDCPGDVEALVAWRLVTRPAKGSRLPSAELIPEVEKEYLVKWKLKSYFRNAWMPGDWVWGVSNAAMRRAFFNSPKARKPIWTAEEAIPEENLRVDIVFDVTFLEGTNLDDQTNPESVKEAYVKYKGLNYEDSVWESPPNPKDTDRWEDFKLAFTDWLHRDSIDQPNRHELKSRLANSRRLNFEKHLVLNAQPELITGGQLMDYQLDGVNWLYYMFLKQQNAILADDMGLGKTVQVISLFATLIEKHSCWPFLVVAPNSTVPNWRREIKMWAPRIRVVTYFGSAFARQMANDYEMFPQRGKTLQCHVVIASYESMVDEEAKRVLNKIHWAGLVVDEGQRLKNDKSQLYERLCRMKFDFKALLTGTPLQNNTRELFNLIQFLDPDKNATKLEEEYGKLTAENIRCLHEMIRPFFLRRTKAEVLPFLPPMVQIIIPVSMSVVQKKLYKSILEKNPQLIQAICKKQTGHLKKAEKHNLNNILVQLRKCLCHPFIYNKAIEEQTNDHRLAFQRLVEASGKLKLLNIMLPKLQKRGNRVLIFSQFLENLDIVEDFLSGLDLSYCRLDGKLTARQKQQQIDAFNEPDSPFFAFLLSTRSGGVVINLATADTVIIMDPDFNPKQDMQALSRAHRIGQKNTVLVFHLTTRATVEEKIMQKGKKKLALDHVLIERMEATEEEEDLESILRHGASDLFSDNNSQDIHYDAESIDKLLDRSQVEIAEQIASDTPGSSSEQPQFNFARVWQKDRGILEEAPEDEETPDDTTAWAEILLQRERAAQEEEFKKAEGLGRGKRKRATINYQTVREDDDTLEPDPAMSSPVKTRKRGNSDVEFQAQEEAEESDFTEDVAGIQEISPPRQSSTAPFQRVQYPPPEPTLGLDGSLDLSARCIACNQYHLLGRCRLKQAGVEHCPLCGLAHFGGRRACTHFHSETQLRRMLAALRQSTEDPELVSLAKKYVRGVLGHLTAARKKAMMPDVTPAATSQASTSDSTPANVTAPQPGSYQHPYDLTNINAESCETPQLSTGDLQASS
ncbi:Chromatin remodeling factor mit1 [Penicillium rolfsii]|nr:Chromatin remodeling factor mit1 [Penicillium rolfsii]